MDHRRYGHDVVQDVNGFSGFGPDRSLGVPTVGWRKLESQSQNFNCKNDFLGNPSPSSLPYPTNHLLTMAPPTEKISFELSWQSNLR